MIEVVLILLALLLFVVTDSRTIKYIAETSLGDSKLQYGSIEGNLFNGLLVQNLSYEKKPLCNAVTIHWNPLTLLYNKITITQLDAQGVELDNVLYLLQNLGSEESNSTFSWNFSLALNASHFDINPYVYEGVKFSSFVLESGKIEVDENLTIDTKPLYLKFDSDLVNVTLDAEIKQSVLWVDDLALKNISVKDIGTFSSRIRAKYADEKELKSREVVNNRAKPFMPIKAIKIKHILGTLKPVRYSDFKIEDAALNLYDAVVDPFNNFEYDVKKLDFKGKTNFGLLQYKGYVKDSNLYAQGDIRLDKHLFTKYDIPLNFKNLKKLPSRLHLNHDAVWIDIDHKAKNLLAMKSDFNLNVTKAKHKLHYDYRSEHFTVKSIFSGDMPYAKAFTVENKLLIDEKAALSYEGKVMVKELRALPTFVSGYLVPEAEGTFKGDDENFEMQIESALLSGEFSMPKYKRGVLRLESKKSNIALNKLINNLPVALAEKKMALKSESNFDFQNIAKSTIDLNGETETFAVDAKMTLQKPYKVDFLAQLKDDADFRKIAPMVNFLKLQRVQGSVTVKERLYDVNIKGDDLKLSFMYDSESSMIHSGLLNIANETFSIQKGMDKSLEVESSIGNLHAFLENFKEYYKIDLPNIQGSLEAKLKQSAEGSLRISLKSPNLKYLSDKGVKLNIINFYDVEMLLHIRKDGRIEIDNYRFKIDDNAYLNSFYANKKSYLRFDNGVLDIQKFWIHDNASIQGKYNIDKSEGDLTFVTNAYRLQTKDFDLLFNSHLDITVKQEKVDVDGDIEILGNSISYALAGSGIVEDSDIVIMNDMLQNEESSFKNLKLYVKVKNKKPLKYVSDEINIAFLNELSILKNFNSKMMVTGMSTITNGYYQLEDKRFTLDKSQLYFTGDMKKPLLDIKANYEKEQYVVHVFISGTTDAPIVNFNAEPYLTQQEILSLILFDGTGSSSGKGAEAYTLLGGTFAKGLIKSLGIDVDHLLLGQDAEDELSLEVGKKISDNVSVLYLHKDGLDGVKVRVEHSKNFETDIVIQPPNTSSIEFLYKGAH